MARRGPRPDRKGPRASNSTINIPRMNPLDPHVFFGQGWNHDYRQVGLARKHSPYAAFEADVRAA